MNFLTGTVSLLQLDNLYLAISVADTLMIGQSSEVMVSPSADKSVGNFEYGGAMLPAYFLNDQLTPDQDDSLLKQNQFCIGLRTAQEANYFALLCKKFEQIDLAEEVYSLQELPGFMCNETMLVEGMLEYKNLIYLVTSPDKIIDYISSKDVDQKQGGKNA